MATELPLRGIKTTVSNPLLKKSSSGLAAGTSSIHGNDGRRRAFKSRTTSAYIIHKRDEDDHVVVDHKVSAKDSRQDSRPAFFIPGINGKARCLSDKGAKQQQSEQQQSEQQQEQPHDIHSSSLSDLLTSTAIRSSRKGVGARHEKGGGATTKRHEVPNQKSDSALFSSLYSRPRLSGVDGDLRLMNESMDLAQQLSEAILEKVQFAAPGHETTARNTYGSRPHHSEPALRWDYYGKDEICHDEVFLKLKGTLFPKDLNSHPEDAAPTTAAAAAAAAAAETNVPGKSHLAHGAKAGNKNKRKDDQKKKKKEGATGHHSQNHVTHGKDAKDGNAGEGVPVSPRDVPTSSAEVEELLLLATKTRSGPKKKKPSHHQHSRSDILIGKGGGGGGGKDQHQKEKRKKKAKGPKGIEAQGSFLREKGALTSTTNSNHASAADPSPADPAPHTFGQEQVDRQTMLSRRPKHRRRSSTGTIGTRSQRRNHSKKEAVITRTTSSSKRNNKEAAKRQVKDAQNPGAVPSAPGRQDLQRTLSPRSVESSLVDASQLDHPFPSIADSWTEDQEEVAPDPTDRFFGPSLTTTDQTAPESSPRLSSLPRAWSFDWNGDSGSTHLFDSAGQLFGSPSGEVAGDTGGSSSGDRFHSSDSFLPHRFFQANLTESLSTPFCPFDVDEEPLPHMVLEKMRLQECMPPPPPLLLGGGTVKSALGILDDADSGESASQFSTPLPPPPAA